MPQSKQRHPTLPLRKDIYAGLEFEAQYGPYGGDYGGGFNTADQYSSHTAPSNRHPQTSGAMTNPLVYAVEEVFRDPAAARAFHHAKQVGFPAPLTDEAAVAAAGAASVSNMDHQHTASPLEDNTLYDPRLFDFHAHFSPPMLSNEQHSQSPGHNDTDRNLHMHNRNNNVDDFGAASTTTMADPAPVYGSCSSSSWDAPLLAGVPNFEPMFATYDDPQTVNEASPYLIEDLSPTGHSYGGTSTVLQPSSRAWSEHASMLPHPHDRQYYHNHVSPSAIEPAQLESHRASRASVSEYGSKSSSAGKHTSSKTSSTHNHSDETATSSARAQPQQASRSKSKGNSGTTGKKTKKSSSSSSSSHPPIKTSKSRSTTTASTPEFRNPFDAHPRSPLSPQNHESNLFAVGGVAGASDYSNTTTPPTPLSIVSPKAENKLVVDHLLEQHSNHKNHKTASSHRSSSASSRHTPHHAHGAAAKNRGSTKHHHHYDEAPQELNQQLPSSPPPTAATTAATTSSGTSSNSIQRQRNRLAATKCRAKSRAAVAELEATERGMRFQHMELSDTAMKLKDEVLALKNDVLRHGNCDCVHIKEYLTNAARAIGGSMGAASNAQLSHGAGHGGS